MQQRRDWAERSLERYGMPLIIVCRFIPGGRTAVMLCCGIVGYQRRRFVIATAAAGLIWASYSFFIGRLGGRAFEDKPWAGPAAGPRPHARRQHDHRSHPPDPLPPRPRCRGGRGARSGRGADGQNGREPARTAQNGPDGPDGQNGRPAQSQTADTARERPDAVAESPADTPKRPDPASERHHEPTGPRIAPNSETSGSR